MKKTSFADIIVNRPVLMIVINVIVVILGLRSFYQLEMRNDPDTRQKTVYVAAKTHTSLKPSVLAKSVTSKIEKSLHTVKDIDFFSSRTTEHSTNIQINFKSSVNLEEKKGEIRDIIANRYHKFPKSLEMPIIQSLDDQDKGLEVLNVYFFSKKMNIDEIGSKIKSQLKPNLSHLGGVGKVKLSGSGKEHVIIKYNIAIMAQLGITPDNIERAVESVLKNSKTNFGKIKSENQEFSVISKNLLKTVGDIENILINPNLKIKDIGSVEVKKSYPTKVYCNGDTEAISMSVSAMFGQSHFTIAENVKKELDKFLKKNPDIGYYIEDKTKNTKEMFDVAKSSFLEACILVIIIVFIFLWSFGATVIPLVSIPISIIATFFPMELLGYSINNKTIAAFIMAIGLVVDDSMFFIEYIMDRIRRGKNKYDSTIESLKELTFPIIVMTITLAVVFFPLVFAPGEIGNELREYAATLSIAVIFSGISSLTLTPIMCVRLLSSNFSHRHEMFIEFIKRIYGIVLNKLMDFRYFFVLTSIFSFGSLGYYAYNFIPQEDNVATSDEYVRISAFSSRLRIEETKKAVDKDVKRLAQIMKKLDVSEFFAVSNREKSIFVNVVLKPEFASEKAKNIIVEIINKYMINKQFFLDSSNERSSSNTVKLVVYGDQSTQKLDMELEKLTNFLRKKGYIKTSYGSPTDRQGVSMIFDYNKALNNDLNVAEICSLLTNFLTRRKFKTEIAGQSKTYDILMVPQKPIVGSFEKIKSIPFKTQGEKKKNIFFLSDYFQKLEKKLKHFVYHYMGKPSVDCTLVLSDNVKLGPVISAIQKETESYESQFAFKEKAKAFIENSSTLLLIFVLACLFIILIIAAQFESFGDSFLVFSAVPLAMNGAILVMAYKNSINRSSIVGLITLIGLITKHGILFIQAANSMTKDPNNKNDFRTSIIEASKSRIIPIIMTSAAMIIGLVPLAISKKDSIAELREVSTIVIFGLAVGTLMTVFVLPMLYFIFKKSPDHSQIYQQK